MTQIANLKAQPIIVKTKEKNKLSTTQSPITVIRVIMTLHLKAEQKKIVNFSLNH